MNRQLRRDKGYRIPILLRCENPQRHNNETTRRPFICGTELSEGIFGFRSLYSNIIAPGNSFIHTYYYSVLKFISSLIFLVTL